MDFWYEKGNFQKLSHTPNIFTRDYMSRYCTAIGDMIIVPHFNWFIYKQTHVLKNICTLMYWRKYAHSCTEDHMHTHVLKNISTLMYWRTYAHSCTEEHMHTHVLKIIWHSCTEEHIHRHVLKNICTLMYWRTYAHSCTEEHMHTHVLKNIYTGTCHCRIALYGVREGIYCILKSTGQCIGTT